MEETENKEILTEKEVVETLEALNNAFDIMNFAKGYNDGVYTPLTQNTLMQNLNIAPRTGDKNEIDEALRNPANSEQKLVSLGQSYYFSSFMYKRNIEYMANLPAFDLELSCVNAKPEDYNSSAYKRDYEKVVDFLNKFNYREQFRNIMWNLMMEETYYGMFREFDEKYIIQQWPWNYAKVTGRFEYGLLYDIDMNYFTQGIVDLKCYPKLIQKTYNELFRKGNRNAKYRPSNSLNNRTGKFALWTQTSPEEGFWCFKFNANHALQVPFFTGIIPDMYVLPLLRELQLSQSMAAARKLLVSSVPYLKEKKSSSVANQLAIDSDVLGKFIGLATQGLEKAIKILSLPTEDIKGVEFRNTDEDTYKNFVSITSSLLSGAKVIFSANDNKNVIETQLALNLDEMLAESVYPQFENFLNYYINRRTKKFKWVFKFVGSNDQFNRKRRQEEAFAYGDKGIVLPNKLASSLGLNKIELERELEEAKATGFTDKLSMLLNVNTMSSDKIGRPAKEDGTLTESGAKTRAAGSNIEKGGNI